MELKRQVYVEEINQAKINTEFLASLMELVNPKRKKMETREMASQVLMVLAEDDPHLLQPFADDFYSFFFGKNSFSKLVSLYCIAGLVLANLEPQFEKRIEQYVSMLNDASVMIASHCAINCGRIAAEKHVFEPVITEAFLAVTQSDHKESRMDLVIAYVINAFSKFANQSARVDEINAFVWRQMENASPKAREASNNYIAKFQGV